MARRLLSWTCFQLFYSTFLDENVNLAKRQRLLENSLTLLRRISTGAPVAVWARSRSTAGAEDQQLLIPLLEAAHDIWKLQTSEAPTHQLHFPITSIQGEPMGRTLPSATQLMLQEEAALSRFRRALRRGDQLAFDDLFSAAQKHVSAAAYAAHALPFETFLMAMLLEEHKEVMRLRASVKMLEEMHA